MFLWFFAVKPLAISDTHSMSISLVLAFWCPVYRGTAEHYHRGLADSACGGACLRDCHWNAGALGANFRCTDSNTRSSRKTSVAHRRHGGWIEKEWKSAWHLSRGIIWNAIKLLCTCRSLGFINYFLKYVFYKQPPRILEICYDFSMITILKRFW